MEVIAYVSLALLLGFFTVSLINIFWGPNLSRGIQPISFPSVSVLVPARNEEGNIGRCLDSLLNQDYPDYEILVLNDESTDGTAGIVQDYIKKDNRIRLLDGMPPAQGWLGKNWACNQLSRQAGGEVFIFTDADTWHDPNALKNTVGWMEKYNLDALSVFSQQVMRSLSERILVPWIDLILYTLLPLWSVYLLPLPSLSAANGQWITFRRKGYDTIKGHHSVRNEVVEDVALFRRAKEAGLKVMTLAGTGMVYCRMYSNLKQIWAGFTKILFGLTGNSFPVFVIFLGFMTLAYLFPLIGLALKPSLPVFGYLLILGMLIRTIQAWHFRHPLFAAVIWHPISTVFLIVMAINSFIQARWGKLVWKERSIVISPKAEIEKV